jgi:GH15 family glucan-1,4-alpha-glucosidase
MHADEFAVEAGEELVFSSTYVRSHLPLPRPLETGHRMVETLLDSEDWADRCSYTGPYREAVLRSLLTLRILTHSETGGIVAAPTTSLPEDFGGERNWDYRYCWLRDASLTLRAFLACGYTGEAGLWRDWLLRAVAGDPADLQIMYAVDGGRELPERELDHLSGYAGSRPVRVGNDAVGQRQSDVVGAVMDALAMARDEGLDEDEDSWSLQRTLVDDLAEHWKARDHGLWEIRGPQRHFTHSRVMVWVAFDRAIRAVEEHGLTGAVDRWRQVRDDVRAEILEHGFNRERNTFTQHYETDAVDAALLMIPAVGFLPGDDPRVLGTIAAVEDDLLRDGLVLRYRTETGVDGVPGDEHPFLACSFWLVSAYAHAGRTEDARRLMERLLALTNDVGLLSEEYDVSGERMAGNFPQAFSHLALVEAATTLEAVGSSAEGRGRTRGNRD